MEFLFFVLAALGITCFLTGGLLDIHSLIVVGLILGFAAWAVFARCMGP